VIVCLFKLIASIVAQLTSLALFALYLLSRITPVFNWAAKLDGYPAIFNETATSSIRRNYCKSVMFRIRSFAASAKQLQSSVHLAVKATFIVDAKLVAMSPNAGRLANAERLVLCVTRGVTRAATAVTFQNMRKLLLRCVANFYRRSSADICNC